MSDTFTPLANPTSQDHWDQQFKFSTILPDFKEYWDWFPVISDRLSAARTFERLSYGPDARQWVELTAGDRGDDDGVIPVIIHGGYWRAMTAEGHRLMIPALAPIGSTVANVEYRLMPGARLADLVADVVAALQKVRSAVGPDAQLLLVGHSAGAHLAVEAADHLDLQGHVNGVVALSGLYDLAPVTHSFLQAELGLTEAEVSTYSPLRRHLRQECRLWCLAGAEETDEFRRQSLSLADQIGSPVHLVAGVHHMSLVANLAKPDTPLARAIQAFAAGGPLPTSIEGFEKRELFTD